MVDVVAELLLLVFMAGGLAAPKIFAVEFEGADVVPAPPNILLLVVPDAVVDGFAPNTLPNAPPPVVEAGVVDDPELAPPNTKALCYRLL